jgi:nicotianamine synthase
VRGAPSESSALPAEIADVLALRTYRPGTVVDAVMGRLVAFAIGMDGADLDLPTRTLAEVQAVCSATETELEHAWARRVASAVDPEAALAEFPYLGNYVELVGRELDLLAGTGLVVGADSRVLVVGGGPLPLTGIEVARATGAQVDVLDRSGDATAAARQVCEALGAPVRVLWGDGETADLGARYDVIVLAALVGATVPEKQAVVNHLLGALERAGRLVVRSARGRRVLLYPGFGADELSGVSLLAVHHPCDAVINSVLVYEPRGDAGRGPASTLAG